MHYNAGRIDENTAKLVPRTSKETHQEDLDREYPSLPRGGLLDTVQRWRTSSGGVVAVVSLALFTDMVLYDVIVPILPVLLDRVGKDETWVGTLFAVYAVGYLVFTPVFGAWSDFLHDRKVPMLFGQAGLAIATVLFATAPSFHMLMVARLLQGVAAACSWTLGLALLADSFPPERLGEAMGIVFGFNTFGYFAGPLLGGVLTQMVSIECPFYVSAVLAVVDLMGRLFIVPPTHHQRGGSPSRQKNLSILALLGYLEIDMIGLTIVLSSASFAAVETLLSRYLGQQFGLNVMAISFVMMAIIVPSIVFSFLAGTWSDRYCRYTLILAGMCIYLLAPPLLALAPSLPLFVLAAVYFGATSAAVSAPSMPEMAAVVHRLGGTAYARVYAIVNICYSLGMLGGPIVAAWLNSAYGFTYAMCFFSLLIALYIPPFLWITLRSRRGELASFCHFSPSRSNLL